MKILEKIKTFLKSDKQLSGRTILILVGIMFLGGIIFSLIFSTALSYTNRTEFCTSCHSMQNNLMEMKQRIHYSNHSGVSAGCHDCHVPHDLGPLLWAKLMAAKDVWHEILGTIDTREKFEEHRWEMANAVWAKMKATDSRECQKCHSFDHMDFEKQSRSAAKQHRRIKEARDKVAALNDPPSELLEIAQKTCIDCHKGIAHEEPVNPEDEDVEDEETEETEAAAATKTEKPNTPAAVTPIVAKPHTFKMDPNAKNVIPATIDANWDGATLADKMCAVCHGKDGNSHYDEVPSIAGYSTFYFTEAMKDYKTGDRPSEMFQAQGYNPTNMKAITEKLSDDQLAKLADHFAAQEFKKRPQYFDAKLAKKGKRLYKRYCEKCHSENGTEPSDDAGILGGQSMSYLQEQLKYFKEGKRTQDKKMAIALKKLKPGDLNKILHFFAQHEGPIVPGTPSEPTTTQSMPQETTTPAATTAVVLPPVVSIAKTTATTEEAQAKEVEKTNKDACIEVETAKAKVETALAKAEKALEQEKAANKKKLLEIAAKLDGAKLAQDNCQVCHGKDGNSSYNKVPNIAGLSSAYLTETLNDYKNGDRPSEKFKAKGHDETDMKAVTKQLNEAELIAIANYFAGQEFQPRQQKFDANLAKQGERLYKSYCKTCHSKNGSDPSDDSGILAGQSKDYLAKQLYYIKQGTRVSDEKMAQVLHRLTEDDINKLLNFFAQPFEQKPVGPYDYSKLRQRSQEDIEEARAEAKAKAEMVKLRQAAKKLDGAKLATENCKACHGKYGNSSYDEVPNIAGLSSSYLTETMMDYKNGDRPSEKFKAKGHDETDMQAITKQLSDAEIIAISDYFASQDFESRKQSFDANLAKQGERLYKDNCKTCHSHNGSDADDDAGILAGQSRHYLQKQLSYFKDGTRVQEAKMAKVFKKLKEGDIEKLLNFFAAQQ